MQCYYVFPILANVWNNMEICLYSIAINNLKYSLSETLTHTQPLRENHPMAIKTMKNYFHTHSQVIYLYLFICSFSILTQIQKKIRFVLYTKCIYKYKFLEKNPEDMNLKTWTIMFQCFILFCVKKLYNAFHVSVVYESQIQPCRIYKFYSQLDHKEN